MSTIVENCICRSQNSSYWFRQDANFTT